MTRRRIGDWIIGLGVGVTAGCAGRNMLAGC